MMMMMMSYVVRCVIFWRWKRKNWESIALSYDLSSDVKKLLKILIHWRIFYIFSVAYSCSMCIFSWVKSPINVYSTDIYSVLYSLFKTWLHRAFSFYKYWKYSQFSCIIHINNKIFIDEKNLSINSKKQSIKKIISLDLKSCFVVEKRIFFFLSFIIF